MLADPIIKFTCPFCKGKKSVEINGETLYCQNCDDGAAYDAGQQEALKNPKCDGEMIIIPCMN